MLKIIATSDGKDIINKEILDENNNLTTFGGLMIAAELTFDITVAVVLGSLIAKRRGK